MKDKLFGSVKGALRRAGGTLQGAAGKRSDADEAVEPDEPTAKPTVQPASRRVGSEEGAGDDFVDPLAEDDLETRFAALEKKLAQRAAECPPK